MATWTSLAVLSALAVSTLSFPGPDGAYKIPQVGTGRRSQYFVLHSDGTYKYGHDTGEGAFESARSSRVGQQQGNFGYVDPEGNSINLQYEAGEGGFLPQGDHLPEPHPDFYAAHAEARARPPFVDPLANTNTDASYNFQYAGEGQHRSEQSDASGNVRGSYSYTDENGQTRTYSYTAGSDTGFVVEGNDLPVAPDTPEASGSTPAATRYSSSGSRFSASSHQGVGSSRSPSTTYSAYRPSGSSRPATSFGGAVRAGSSNVGRFSPSQSNTNTDGSYSFSYNAGDHSRSESADSNLNVEGQYSFVADDGITRSVNYESGANRGFQASGDHLPTSPSANHFGNAASSSFRGNGASSSFRGNGASSSFSGVQSTYRAPSSSSTSAATHRFSSTRQPSTFGTQTYSSSSSSSSRVPFEEANTRSELRPDGSYAFAYETSSHSRDESGDTNNNVDGDFAFVADDGQRREIRYEAGSDTGFIAEGAHIPVGPIVPGAPSGQPTGRIVPVQEIPFVDPLADTNADASYNFAFDSEQYSRSETADADGNVQGTYTVVDDDGTRRSYRFRAGEGVGFETEEVSSSRGAAPSRASFSSSSSSHGGAASNRFTSSSSVGSQSLGARHQSSSFNRQPAAASSGYSASSSVRSSDSSDFQLHQYEASKNPNKFGYVLTFDK